MRDKKRILILLLCLCVVLGFTVFMLLRHQDETSEGIFEESAAEHEHEIDPSFVENTTGELLIDKESADIDTLVLSNANGTFTIKRDSVTASLYIEEIDRDIPISDDFIEYVWYYGYCLGYNYKIISTTDSPVVYSDFGLDSPAASFSVSYKDGSAISFDVGNSLVTSDDIHYISFNGYDNTVFITEMSLAAFQGESYFIDTDFFGVSSEEDDIRIGTVKISGSAIPDKIVIEPYSSDDRSDQSYGHSHILTSPVKAAVNDTNATALVNELIYLAADSAVVSSPDKKTLAEYGLDKPTLVFTFERNGKQQVLSIGKTDRTTYCYAMLKGLDVIYNIDPAQAEAILSSSLSFYRSGELRRYSMQAVESVTVSFLDETHEFSVTRSALSEDDYYEYHAFSGNLELNLDYYRDFLSVLSSAYAVNWDNKAASDSAYLTVTVDYFDSFDRDDDVLEFYEADYGRYVCSINGKKTANVSSIYLVSVIDASRRLSENKKI